jgi:hypothetical protein
MTILKTIAFGGLGLSRTIPVARYGVVRAAADEGSKS